MSKDNDNGISLSLFKRAVKGILSTPVRAPERVKYENRKSTQEELNRKVALRMGRDRHLIEGRSTREEPDER